MANNVKSCIRCGRLFRYPGFGEYYCEVCKEQDNEEFERVKQYLDEHGLANAYEISVATGVSEKTITRFLTESRLEIPEGSPIYLKCRACGCDIRSGKYCATCAARLSEQLSGTYKAYVGDKPKIAPSARKIISEKTGKMHIDRNKESRRLSRFRGAAKKKPKDTEEDV